MFCFNTVYTTHARTNKKKKLNKLKKKNKKKKKKKKKKPSKQTKQKQTKKNVLVFVDSFVHRHPTLSCCVHVVDIRPIEKERNYART